MEVRGTTRTEKGVAAIEAAGIEAEVADPHRPGTILDLVGDVALVVWLLGSAHGEPEVIAAIHGPRLEGLLGRLVDTPVRGFVYESSGRVQQRYLDGGAEIVESAARTWSIPVAVLREEPGEDWDRWAADAADRTLELLR
jgi:hypothetical protein